MSPLYTQVQMASKFVRDPSLRWKLACLLRGLERKDVALACAQFGIHRTTFYRWLGRLQDGDWNPEAIRPRSRRPHTCPWKISFNLKTRILAYRKEFHYGPHRIAWHLSREGFSVSAHGVYNVLKRGGVAFRKHREKRQTHRKRYVLDRPGQGLQLDIKYVPFPIEGKRAFVFNVIDDCSRWRFQWAYRHKGNDESLDFLQRLFKAAPFPIEQIQTDNDVCFTNRFQKTPKLDPSGPHPFACMLKSKGIHHKLLPPGQKELNGKVERSHKTDDQEFYWRLPLWISFADFQRQLLRWTYEYNHFRPHSGVQMKTPVQRLADFEIQVQGASAGAWTNPQNPTHYELVIRKLQNYRRNHPEEPLIHWQFKPLGTPLRTNPTWQKNMPSTLKSLLHLSGITTKVRG